MRRLPLVFRLNGVAVPALTAETLRVVQNKKYLSFRSDDGDSGLFGAEPGVAAVETPNGEVATAPDGSIWIAYAGEDKARNVSAAALDNGELASGQLAHAIVILGPPGAAIATPAACAASPRSMPRGWRIFFSVRRRCAGPASAIEAELICLAIFGLAAIILFARFGLAWSGLFTGASIVGALFVSWRLYTADHTLFDALGPGIALALTYLTATIVRGAGVASARAKVRSAFAESLPPSVIEQIARRPELLRLEGTSRTVTYLHCGVREFGGLADSFKDDPAAFTRLMQARAGAADGRGRWRGAARSTGSPPTGSAPSGTRRSTIPSTRSTPARRRMR